MLVYIAMIDSQEERSKFERIYLEYRSLMFYVASQILHNDADAEDAVHNAFIKIAENISKIDEPVCPKTKSYVVIIAESKAIDIYRYNQRNKTAVNFEDMVGVNYDNTAQGLSGCILKLPARYRHVILLKYHHGYSCKEIAKILGISEANAIKLDQRAKQKLLVLCREEGIL